MASVPCVSRQLCEGLHCMLDDGTIRRRLSEASRKSEEEFRSMGLSASQVCALAERVCAGASAAVFQDTPRLLLFCNEEQYLQRLIWVGGSTGRERAGERTHPIQATVSLQAGLGTEGIRLKPADRRLARGSSHLQQRATYLLDSLMASRSCNRCVIWKDQDASGEDKPKL